MGRTIGFTVTKEGEKTKHAGPSFIERIGALSKQMKENLRTDESGFCQYTEEDVDKAIEALVWMHYNKEN